MNLPEEFPRVSDIVGRYEDTSFYDDFSRDRGNEVHRAIKGILKGLWVPPLKLHQGYIDSFLGWKEEMVEEVILVEEPLVCVEFGFRGKPDAILKLKGDIGLSIPDWKTSASASTLMKKCWRLRISGGYRILAESNGYKPIQRCLAIQLNADGKPAKATAEGELLDAAYFLRALDLNRFLFQ
jgi:hypothetical protein